MWPIEEYAISRLILVCPIAASAPSTIEAIDTITTSNCHAPTSEANEVPITRSSSAIAATFGAVAKNTVTDVGAPSYTSGVHMWNGTADTLNASPTSTNTIPTTRPGDALSGFTSSSCSEVKSMVPENPYTSEMPYSSRPEDRQLRTKYFRPASADRRSSRANAAST